MRVHNRSSYGVETLAAAIALRKAGLLADKHEQHPRPSKRRHLDQAAKPHQANSHQLIVLVAEAGNIYQRSASWLDVLQLHEALQISAATIIVKNRASHKVLFTLDSMLADITVSVGLAHYQDSPIDPVTPLNQADVLVCEAEVNDRNIYRAGPIQAQMQRHF